MIGRLFREFAVTVTMTIAVSAFVSLTLTPMMCSKFIRDEKHAKHGRLYLMTERFFDGMLAAYTRGLDFVLRHQRTTLIVFFITLATTVGLYVVEPKGFFPSRIRELSPALRMRRRMFPSTKWCASSTSSPM
ncbi:MAG: efflux RND transporter permease subunit [Nitrosomonadales bacterium]